MKNTPLKRCQTFLAMLLVSAFSLVSPTVGAAPGSETNDPTESPAKSKPGPATRREEIILRKVEPGEPSTPPAGKTVPWLGVSTDEISETLTAQLGLDPGVGLVVGYAAKDSPAAKAGLRKHDVLTAFDDQALVHPSQLRKLVRSRHEGDTVQLTLYRAGDKQTVSVVLGKTEALAGPLDLEHHWKGDLEDLKQQLRDLRIGETVRENMKDLHESLRDLDLDREDLKLEIRRGLYDAHAGLREAFEQLKNLPVIVGPVAEVLKELSRSGIHLDRDARVVVRSTGNTTRSLVQADDSGTVVIVANPTRRLTAHDAQGKLVFDGEIETPEQQDRVPRDLWRRVEPLLDKMNADQPPEPPAPPTPAPPAEPESPEAPDAPDRPTPV